MEGRSAEEMHIIATILKKAEQDEKLQKDEKELIDALTPEDLEAIKVAEDAITNPDAITAEDGDAVNDEDDDLVLTPDELYSEVEGEASGPLTVAALRNIYTGKLKGTGVSVEHLLNVADLTDDDQVVDLAAFTRFLQPACP